MIMWEEGLPEQEMSMRMAWMIFGWDQVERPAMANCIYWKELELHNGCFVGESKEFLKKVMEPVSRNKCPRCIRVTQEQS